VEGWTFSEAEKEAAHGVRAGYVGTLATRYSFSPPLEKEERKTRKTFG
jgi:hypothetical protein